MADSGRLLRNTRIEYIPCTITPIYDRQDWRCVPQLIDASALHIWMSYMSRIHRLLKPRDGDNLNIQDQVEEVTSLPWGQTVVSARGAQDPIMRRIDSLGRNDRKAYPWWRHQMETFSALLAICAGNSPVPGEFPTQRPVTRSCDVFFLWSASE